MRVRSIPVEEVDCQVPLVSPAIVMLIEVQVFAEDIVYVKGYR
jgi:hypothetical protein